VDTDDDRPGAIIPSITMRNSLEEAANRYWRAALMWNSRIPTNWTTGDMIHECVDMQRYRGAVIPLVNKLLGEVIQGNFVVHREHEVGG